MQPSLTTYSIGRVSAAQSALTAECVKQHHMVVCDFITLIPGVKKRKFSPRMRTCRLRDPATASLFQLAFKLQLILLKVWLLILQIVLRQFGQSWNTFCWMLPRKSKSVVSPRTTSGDLKSGDKMNMWKKPYKRSGHGSKPTRPWKREARWLMQRRQRLPVMTSAWQSTPSDWQSLRQRKRNPPQYPQTVIVFSVSSLYYAPQAAKQWAPWGAPQQCVCDPDI